MDEFTEQARELGARRIERRRFLKGALGVAGLAIAQGTPLARALVRRSAGTLPGVPKESGLDTIVIAMMENRSLDHYLGWLPGIDGIQEGLSNPTKLAAPPGGCPTSALAVTDATPVSTFRLTQHCQVPDPDHGWNGSRVEYNHGVMNGFADRSGAVAMGFYKEEDIPFLGWLARNFNTFSRYFCSVMGPTFPNREYLYSAQSGGHIANDLPLPSQSNPLPTGFTWPTILDRLNAAGVPWAAYGSDVPTAWLFFHHNYDSPGRIRHITDYFVDAAAGTLPSVVFLDPSFFTVGNDDHPARDIKLGQRFMYDTFMALAEGPQWPNSAYVLTYDEHGGFYDHVPPPVLPDDRPSANHCTNFGQAGFRVPCVVASPFSTRGVIGSSTFDHTSILKLIEWRFALPALTPRDAAANNLGEVLNFDNPVVELPSEPPFIPLHTAGAYCWVSQVPDLSEGENPLEPLPDLPVPAPVVPDPPEEPHAELRALADSGFFGRYDMRERAAHGVWRD